ncbi:MAG: GNAT family N-acetyltransferase [Saprospiraceae bacterium]|nr:GNAT family N-acetyltransferase [Saprospiraceae bacterium]
MSTPGKNILETERLILRQFSLEDDAFIVELLNSPGWLAYIGDRGVKTLTDARAYLVGGPMASFETHGFGLAMVALRETGEGIGMCGLIKRDSLPDVDIGYALLPAFTGQGYAFEIASATVDHAREQHGLRRLLAITDQENVASIKLLKKLGMQLVQEVQLRPDDIMLYLFGMDL